MSEEFENDFELSEEDAAAADPSNEIVEAVVEDGVLVDVEAEEGPSEDDFFAENEAAEVPAVDPEKVVTIQTTSSSDKYVEVEGPMAMLDLIHKASLRFEGDFTCFLNGAEISLTTTVPGGSTVTIAGKVKGGAR